MQISTDIEKVYEINMSELIKKDINKAHIQRIEISEKIKEIVHYQKQYYDKHKRYNFLGVLTIRTLDDVQYYIIDGQHRWHSMKKLYDDNNNYDFFVNVAIKRCDDEGEIEEDFKIINNNTPMPNIVIGKYDYSSRKLFRYFNDKYDIIRDLTKKSKKRPYVDHNKFQEAIEYLLNTINCPQGRNIVDYIIDLVETKNERIKDLFKDAITKNKNYMKNVGYISNCIEGICEHTGFYLGIFPYTDNEFIYEWVYQIVQEVPTNIEIIKKKKSIPKLLRNKVWEKFNGQNFKGQCFCCENELRITDFECGHIVSHKNGGEMNIDNLITLCGICNKSMGTMNATDFIKSHITNPSLIS